MAQHITTGWTFVGYMYMDLKSSRGRVRYGKSISSRDIKARMKVL